MMDKNTDIIQSDIQPVEATHNAQDDNKVCFNISFAAVSDIVAWGNFISVVMIIIMSLACLSVVGLPFGVMGIIIAVRLRGFSKDLLAYAATASKEYSIMAGKDLYRTIKSVFIYVLIELSITVFLITLAFLIVSGVFADLKALFDEAFTKAKENIHPGIVDEFALFFRMM